MPVRCSDRRQKEESEYNKQKAVFTLPSHKSPCDSGVKKEKGLLTSP